jgi:hypothetical protein
VANADSNSRLTPELEATLRRYALGGLPEGARSELEQQLVTDPDVFETLGVVEDDLIEEYLDGTSTELDRGAFERHFLTSPVRVARLRFARALRTHAARGMAAEPARPQPATAVRVARWQPAWLGLAAALAASLAGNVWLANRSAQPRPTEASAPGSGTTSPTFTLATGLLRSGGSLTRVNVPNDSAVVRLRLEVPTADSYPTYRATMLDEDGKEIWTAANLRVHEGGSPAVVVPVPAEILPRGDYQVRLSGQKLEGEPEVVGTYTFRVSKP